MSSMPLLMLTLATSSSTASGPSAADEQHWSSEEVTLGAQADPISLPWIEPSGQGMGLGYENGSWGGQWMQGVRINVPLGERFGMNLRGMMLLGTDKSDIDRVDLGARLEFYGRSPVFLNLIRLYGAGGLSVMSPVHGVDQPKFTVGGGGTFGFEFFLLSQLSWILEVGGNAASQGGFGAGATITAGLSLYLF